MESNDLHLSTNRRSFIGTLATGAAAISLGTLAAPLQAAAGNTRRETAIADDDPDAWFNKIKGKHRMVFDATQPNGTFPFAWPRVFLMTNSMTGTPESNSNVVVVLRHNAIPYALNNAMWTKYKFGTMFKIDDAATKTAALRNAFWEPRPGDFQVPGIGNVAIGINELQASGVMFCACNMALTVYSAVAAGEMGMNAADVLKEWTSNLLPGIQVVPSGVWAVGRAQEHGCAYCFAG